jgi:hypothetical protein
VVAPVDYGTVPTKTPHKNTEICNEPDAAVTPVAQSERVVAMHPIMV